MYRAIPKNETLTTWHVKEKTHASTRSLEYEVRFLYRVANLTETMMVGTKSNTDQNRLNQ